MMKNRARHVLLLAALLGLMVAGCSPESQRVRGGGMGSDVGNRQLGPGVQLHGEVDSLYKQPQMGMAVEAQR
jgi:hypothetical protein